MNKNQIPGYLSLIYPGLGHLYLRKYREAIVYAGIPFFYISTYVLSLFIALWGAPYLWRVLHMFITVYWFYIAMKSLRDSKSQKHFIWPTFLVLALVLVALPFYVYMGYIILGPIIENQSL